MSFEIYSVLFSEIVLGIFVLRINYKLRRVDCVPAFTNYTISLCQLHRTSHTTPTPYKYFELDYKNSLFKQFSAQLLHDLAALFILRETGACDGFTERLQGRG